MRLVFVVFLGLFHTFMLGQNESVYGTVVDKNSGEALISATITIAGQFIASTDLDGNFIIPLSAGNHQLKFSYVGYKAITRSIELNPGEKLELNVRLEPDITNMNIVVVSAGRFEQDLGKVTVSMEVINPEMIENKNTTAMDDILQQTPGVVIVDNEPQIRGGSGYSFGAGSRVMILVDDLPILSGDAGRPSWGFLPVENVEQVEVIKGASSVLYGSGALSGVINLRTAYPGPDPETKVILFQGMYSDPHTSEGKYWSGTPMKSGVNFFHSRRIGNIALVVGGSWLGNDGHLGPIHNEDGVPASSKYDPFDVNRYAAENRARINCNLGVQSKKVKGLSYGINTNWLKGESLATLLWGNNTDGLYAAFNGAATRTKQVVGNVDPYVKYLSKNGSQHTLRTRWFQLDNDNDNNQGNFSDVYFGEYQYQQHYDSVGIKGLTSTFGLMAIHTDARGQLYAGGPTNGDNTADNFAAYLQLDKAFWDKLTVSAGFRFEEYSVNDFKQQKPVFRSGVNYQLGQATFVRASFGQGFRFPTIAERFIQTAVGDLVVYPNPELVPESSYNLELGVKQGFKIGNVVGFADAAIFHQAYENFIEFTFGQWNPQANETNLFGLGFKSVNTGRAQVQGLDLSFLGKGQLGPIDLQFLAGYTYINPISLTPEEVYAASEVDPESIFLIPSFEEISYRNTSSDTTNDILKYRMQHLVRADIEASYNKFSAGLSFRWNSHMVNIDKIFLDLDSKDFPHIPLGIVEWRANNTKGDYVFDTRLLYRVNDNNRFALIVSNFLNREYAIRPLTIEEPRTITVQYSFTL